MSDPKRHHWVPECYLRAWWDPGCKLGEKPYVWRIDRETREAKPLPIDQVFVKTHLYTRRKPDGQRDFSVEKMLSKLEGPFERIMHEKIKPAKPLTVRDRTWLAFFTAAMMARPLAQRDHQRKQWQRVVEIAEDMQQAMNKLPPERRRTAAKALGGGLSSGDRSKSMTLDQVRDLVAQPMAHTVVPMTEVAGRVLAKMPLVILTTDSTPGFITSDSPCAVFDPTAYRRPPLYRAAGLAYDTTEVTLPLAPNRLVMFHWKLGGFDGYMPIPDATVDELNRRAQFHADKHIVCCKSETRDYWFDPGEVPADAWKNSEQAKELEARLGPMKSDDE